MTYPLFLAAGCPATPQAVHTAADQLQQPAGHTIELGGPEGYHAVTVKRITVGEIITISNGCGVAADCEVTAISGKDHLTATIVRTIDDPGRISAPSVTVVQGLPKNDRLDATLENLTQFGVATVIPWQASRSIVKWKGAKADKAAAKWQAICQEAAKQSRRLFVPQVAELHTTHTLAAHIAAFTAAGGKAYILHENAAASLSDQLRHDLPPASTTGDPSTTDHQIPHTPGVLCVVGPEGGISDKEVDELKQAGAQPVLLGAEVLRTATAGAAALAVINVHQGRW
ncbi:16S rRNA (uracil(1498)-N(3))-methyltransferase [Corynebacterium choanae]|uniref:Ribosomal RNA small subunit methyltransferase E n=1 Tax=Corynebacterium choanae TaxID=1862358 RepID=A0A3G6JD34_9CORY|nr:16S rRNA (uracil(1498)-N(3))-methyltransferase [Corynebacterium choanae]AZA14064.1 Ribosomal RNA small subunit methyltransferase E [Corynebacterium choanae]